MKQIVFKVSREVAKIIRYLVIIGIIVMFLGILSAVLDGWSQNGMLTLDYGSQIAQVPIWFPMLILLLAAAIFLYGRYDYASVRQTTNEFLERLLFQFWKYHLSFQNIALLADCDRYSVGC